jgi:hypothetical protein
MFNASAPRPYGVDPKLVQLDQSGMLALSAGRAGLHVWLAPLPSTNGHSSNNVLEQLAEEEGGGWTGLNLAQAHNDLVSLAHIPSDMRFTPGWIASGGNPEGTACDPLCEFESTGYTGMVNIPGTDRLLISYDKTPGMYDQGTVPSRVGNRSYIFVMELRVIRRNDA